MSQASDLRESPDDAIKESIAAVEEASKSGDSTSRIDLSFDDGSALVITSHQGANAELHVFEPTGDDAAVAPGNESVAVPKTDDVGPASGVGDDGILRDTAGNEVTD